MGGREEPGARSQGERGISEIDLFPGWTDEAAQHSLGEVESQVELVANPLGLEGVFDASRGGLRSLPRDGRRGSREPLPLGCGTRGSPPGSQEGREGPGGARRDQTRRVVADGRWKCQPILRARANAIVVKYKAVARTDAQAAHAGWNDLPISFYEVWAERKGKAVSETAAPRGTGVFTFLKDFLQFHLTAALP